MQTALAKNAAKKATIWYSDSREWGTQNENVIGNRL